MLVPLASFTHKYACSCLFWISFSILEVPTDSRGDATLIVPGTVRIEVNKEDVFFLPPAPYGPVFYF